MPRVARRDLGTSFFHIVVQGIKKKYIFKENGYMEKYRSLLIECAEKYKIKVLAYCIMSNHTHILVFTEKIEEMSKYMKSINTSYGYYYNKIENRVGFVFRDRYLSEPVYTEEHLLQCLSYIHSNPVKAKMVELEKEYQYSSYNNYINKTGIVTDEILKIVFGSAKNYLETFLIISENIEFIDYDKTKYDVSVEIERYCNNRDLKLGEIIEEEDKLIEIIKYLVNGKKISRIDVAKGLNTYRQRITYLLNKEQE